MSGAAPVSHNQDLYKETHSWCWHPWWSTVSLLLRLYIIFLLKGITVLVVVLRTHNWTQREIEREREGERERKKAPAAKCQFRGSHLPQKPLFQLGLMAPRSQAEVQNTQIMARYKYQLEKENMLRTYSVWKVLKQGGKNKKRKKFSFCKEKTQQNR